MHRVIRPAGRPVFQGLGMFSRVERAEMRSCVVTRVFRLACGLF